MPDNSTYAENMQMVNPLKGGFTTEHAAGALCLGALVFLILVNRGFRGVNFGGASIGVK